LHVLVVDDCRDTTATLSFLLKAWGHEVNVAHDGVSALETAIINRPDVVLLDIGLPGMNGWELASRLREQPGMEDVLLVAVSGYGQCRDQLHSQKVGCDFHLLKPVDPKVLEDLLVKEAKRGSRSDGTRQDADSSE
jgi:CheY-like chemotaxis protein